MSAAVFYGISGLIKYQGYRQQAKAAKMEGALTARNTEQQIKITELKTLQEHNAIMKQLRSLNSTNRALSGIMGRADDRSLMALRKKANKDNMETIARANFQGLADISKLAQQKQMALVKANNLSKGYRLQAMASLADTGAKMSQT
jgi:hypothetical protein